MTYPTHPNPVDARTVSEQEEEIHQLKSLFHSEFPGLRSNEIEAAIATARQNSTGKAETEAKTRDILSSAVR